MPHVVVPAPPLATPCKMEVSVPDPNSVSLRAPPWFAFDTEAATVPLHSPALLFHGVPELIVPLI